MRLGKAFPIMIEQWNAASL